MRHSHFALVAAALKHSGIRVDLPTVARTEQEVMAALDAALAERRRREGGTPAVRSRPAARRH